MTITREVREKVIQLSKEGHGRNEIARLLNEQGLHVSEGSVGNIVRANRQLSYDAAQKSIQSHADVDEQSFANTNDTLSDPVPIRTGIDMSNIGSRVGLANFVIPRDGGPLSHLLNEDSVNPDSTVIPSPKPVDFDDKSYPEFYPVEPDVNVINSPEEEARQYQSTPNSENSSIIGIDWDSDEVWERRFMRYVMDDKRSRQKELQLIENGKCELEEERQQIEQWNNDLQVREDKLNQTLNEIKPLLPSIRELQSNGITFDIIMPYMMAINEKSALENIDLKTAAWNMVHDFRDYRNLGGLRRVIAQAEQRLSELDMLITQRLALNGITERLTQLTGSNYNDDNGHGDLSMTDYIRLNLLKGSTTNMLNRITRTTIHMPFSLHF